MDVRRNNMYTRKFNGNEQIHSRTGANLNANNEMAQSILSEVIRNKSSKPQRQTIQFTNSGRRLDTSSTQMVSKRLGSPAKPKLGEVKVQQHVSNRRLFQPSKIPPQPRQPNNLKNKTRNPPMSMKQPSTNTTVWKQRPKSAGLAIIDSNESIPPEYLDNNVLQCGKSNSIQSINERPIYPHQRPKDQHQPQVGSVPIKTVLSAKPRNVYTKQIRPQPGHHLIGDELNVTEGDSVVKKNCKVERIYHTHDEDNMKGTLDSKKIADAIRKSVHYQMQDDVDARYAIQKDMIVLQEEDRKQKVVKRETMKMERKAKVSEKEKHVKKHRPHERSTSPGSMQILSHHADNSTIKQSAEACSCPNMKLKSRSMPPDDFWNEESQHHNNQIKEIFHDCAEDSQTRENSDIHIQLNQIDSEMAKSTPNIEYKMPNSTCHSKGMLNQQTTAGCPTPIPQPQPHPQLQQPKAKPIPYPMKFKIPISCSDLNIEMLDCQSDEYHSTHSNSCCDILRDEISYKDPIDGSSCGQEEESDDDIPEIDLQELEFIENILRIDKDNECISPEDRVLLTNVLEMHYKNIEKSIGEPVTIRNEKPSSVDNDYNTMSSQTDSDKSQTDMSCLNYLISELQTVNDSKNTNSSLPDINIQMKTSPVESAPVTPKTVRPTIANGRKSNKSEATKNPEPALNRTRSPPPRRSTSPKKSGNVTPNPTNSKKSISAKHCNSVSRSFGKNSSHRLIRETHLNYNHLEHDIDEMIMADSAKEDNNKSLDDLLNVFNNMDLNSKKEQFKIVSNQETRKSPPKQDTVITPANKKKQSQDGDELKKLNELARELKESFNMDEKDYIDLDIKMAMSDECLDLLCDNRSGSTSSIYSVNSRMGEITSKSSTEFLVDPNPLKLEPKKNGDESKASTMEDQINSTLKETIPLKDLKKCNLDEFLGIISAVLKLTTFSRKEGYVQEEVIPYSVAEVVRTAEHWGIREEYYNPAHLKSAFNGPKRPKESWQSVCRNEIYNPFRSSQPHYNPNGRNTNIFNHWEKSGCCLVNTTPAHQHPKSSITELIEQYPYDVDRWLPRSSPQGIVFPDTVLTAHQSWMKPKPTRHHKSADPNWSELDPLITTQSNEYDFHGIGDAVLPSLNYFGNDLITPFSHIQQTTSKILSVGITDTNYQFAIQDQKKPPNKYSLIQSAKRNLINSVQYATKHLTDKYIKTRTDKKMKKLSVIKKPKTEKCVLIKTKPSKKKRSHLCDKCMNDIEPLLIKAQPGEKIRDKVKRRGIKEVKYLARKRVCQQIINKQKSWTPDKVIDVTLYAFYVTLFAVLFGCFAIPNFRCLAIAANLIS